MDAELSVLSRAWSMEVDCMRNTANEDMTFGDV